MPDAKRYATSAIQSPKNTFTDDSFITERVMAATNGNDVLFAIEDGEILHGRNGNDTLSSIYNDTRLLGDDGDDKLNTKISDFNYGTLALAAWQFGGRGNDILSAEIASFSDIGKAEIRQDGGTGDDSIKAYAYTHGSYFAETADFTILAQGGDGNDTIEVIAGLFNTNTGSGTNTVLGGAGNDTIKAVGYSPYSGTSSSLSNIIDSGSGDDIVEAWLEGISNGGDGLYNSLTGGAGNDVLKAYSLTNSNNSTSYAQHELFGGGGNDELKSFYDSSGGDTGITFSASLDGGSGNDRLLAQAYASTPIDGYSGVTHLLNGDHGDDVIDSVITCESAAYYLQADLSGGKGSDTLTAAIDLYTGFGGYPSPSSAANTLNGDDGNDALDAIITFTADYLETDADLTNVLSGGQGADTLNAEIHASMGGSFAVAPAIYTVGDNQLHGGLGNDVLSALIDAQSFDPMITLVGSSALYGEEGNDSLTVFGGTGNVLDGGAGNDTLTGGDGQDTLIGGRGSDTLTGGLEADSFLFEVLEPSYRKDTITDFAAGEDVIALSRSAFAAFASDPAGSLNPSAFVTGSAATTSSQHIIYNSATGALFYDADGVGGAAQVQIASLNGAPALTAGDLVLI